MIFRTATGTHERARREDLIRAAFYHGEALTLSNPGYAQAVRNIADELLRQDSEKGDLTVEALGIGAKKCILEIRAKEVGVAAGLSEARWLYEGEGLTISGVVNDGDRVASGDVLLRAEGRADVLFRLERVIVNLIQRMSGIATATREMVKMIQPESAQTHVVATRKTPWGLLDKKAVHVGGGGTHRLSLSDAILIKTNHLQLAPDEEGMPLERAIRCAWSNRKSAAFVAAFVEVEVTRIEEAVVAASTFRDLRAADSCPCVLMLDNFSPAGAEAAVKTLREQDLHDAALVEASGNIDKNSWTEYAAAGVDAISVGALTHSVRALDVSAKVIPGGR